MQHCGMQLHANSPFCCSLPGYSLSQVVSIEQDLSNLTAKPPWYNFRQKLSHAVVSSCNAQQSNSAVCHSKLKLRLPSSTKLLDMIHLRPNTASCRAKFAQSSIQLPIDSFGSREWVNGHNNACLQQHRSMCAQQILWSYCMVNAELLCQLQVVLDCTHEPCDTAGGLDNDTNMSKYENAHCILYDCPCRSALEVWAVHGSRLCIAFRAGAAAMQHLRLDIGHTPSWKMMDVHHA